MNHDNNDNNDNNNSNNSKLVVIRTNNYRFMNDNTTE